MKVSLEHCSIECKAHDMGTSNVVLSIIRLEPCNAGFVIVYVIDSSDCPVTTNAIYVCLGDAII